MRSHLHSRINCSVSMQIGAGKQLFTAMQQASFLSRLCVRLPELGKK